MLLAAQLRPVVPLGRAPRRAHPVPRRGSLGIRAASPAPLPERDDVQDYSQDLSMAFRPFEEVKPELATVNATTGQESSPAPQAALGRVAFDRDLELALNEQINVEYNLSYVYHSLHAYFDRDNIGLPGMAQYFRDASEDERAHAQKLISYQNIRGGRVRLHTLVVPEAEFEDAAKGEALYSMELALSLEKLNFHKLNYLHGVASRTEDPEAENFVENMLEEQARDVNRTAKYVSQLRRVGKGLGVFEFDRYLQGELGANGAALNGAGLAGAGAGGMGAGLAA